MSSVDGGNYISDGAIMAWLATQQDRIYGDLRVSMTLSETRATFSDELNDIKAHLRQANGSKEHDLTGVDREMQAFMAKYGDDAEFAQACEGLRAMVDKIHQDVQAQGTYQLEMKKYLQEVKDALAEKAHLTKAYSNPGNLPGHGMPAPGQSQQPEKPIKPSGPPYPEDQLKGWEELIDGKLGVATKNDQLTMIHIQELKATLDQSSQLASTFIASGDKTNSAIINNIA